MFLAYKACVSSGYILGVELLGRRLCVYSALVNTVSQFSELVMSVLLSFKNQIKNTSSDYVD